MKRTIFLLLLIFMMQIISAQEATTVKCTVEGFKGKKAYLASIKGGKKIRIDSSLVTNGSFSFSRNTALPLGMYRIFLNDSNYTDIIVNHETVVLSCKFVDMIGSMKVLSSGENKIFYDYLQFTYHNDVMIEPALDMGRKLYKQGVSKNKKQLDSLKTIIDSLNNVQWNFTQNLIFTYKNQFASRVIHTLQIPSYGRYKAQTDSNIYKNESEFLRDHFFDNIDFGDSTLLNTEFIFQSCSEYITSYARPPSNETYMKASDFILGKANVNKTVYDYVLNLLVQTFESSDYEQAFVYLTEKYYLGTSCESDANAKSLAEKAAALKLLAIGKPAPAMTLPDINGKPVDLFAQDAPYTLLIFWSSTCEHCKQMLPLLHPLLLEDITSKRLAVIAVSMDTDKTSWKDAAAKISADWIHVSDLQGFGSETATKYNIWRTPNFYILNKEKKIIARPYSNQQVIARLNELLK